MIMPWPSASAKLGHYKQNRTWARLHQARKLFSSGLP